MRVPRISVGIIAEDKGPALLGASELVILGRGTELLTTSNNEGTTP